ncbi:MAG: imidazolonepropionase-like amidohydrolase [Planctomycetota bacterium]
MKNMIMSLALVGTGAGMAFASEDDGTSWVVLADQVYTATGEVYEGGFVAVSDGKITGVGPGGGSGGSELDVYAVTPGMIDLGARVVTHPDAIEQSTETAVTMRVADALNLFNQSWDRELRSGVTTVLASAPDNNVIGGLSIALKTGGEPTLEARTVKADAALRGSFGTQPSQGNQQGSGTPQSFYVRRPTTRMGVEWEFRKSFYDTIAAGRYEELSFEGSEVLQDVLDGKLPLTVQAWATQDIRTAIYLREEFNIPNMIVDAAAEAWREPELLARSGINVVLPPFSFHSGRVGRDRAFFAWNTAKMLSDLGVPFALSGHGARVATDRLAYQPALAMRGGLSFEAALESVTIAPARMIGIDDRVGSIEVGKDADLVLWSGPPFQPTSRVIGVMLDGHLVLDPRETSE